MSFVPLWIWPQLFNARGEDGTVMVETLTNVVAALCEIAAKSNFEISAS